MPAAAAIHTLIVDDQASMRALIRTSLQQLGFREFREAGDGEAGLRQMIAQPAHLIISDFNMPNLDGLGLLHMRQAGGRTLGQDEATSVVYGMPKAAHELGAVERQLPLGRIGPAILELVSAASPAASQPSEVH